MQHRAVHEQGETTSDRGEDKLRFRNILGQVGASYILAETEEGLAIIDQHAAHERIIYEEIVTSLQEKNTTSQSLLLPVTLELGFREARCLEEHLDMLTTIGFGINHLGENTFCIDATPAWLGNVKAENVIYDFIAAALEERGSSPLKERREDTAKILACKTYTVKANEKLTPEEMETLLDRLNKTRQPFTCPHGRPTIIKLTMDDLAKQFKRK